MTTGSELKDGALSPAVRCHGEAYKNATIQDGINYAVNVCNGDVLACKWVRLACERFLDDLEDIEAGKVDFIFSQNRANHILDFAKNYCVHVKGKRWRGKPVDLMDFHVFILINIFGFVKPMRDEITGEAVVDAEGEEVYIRRFTNAFLLVARKNAKSFLASVIGLYMLFADGEGGSEVYSAATTRDQARIIFDDSSEMVKASSRLNGKLKVTDKAISHANSYSRFMPVSSDAGTLDGKNVHCALIDEIHAHKKRDVYDVLETATGSRDQPLILTVSTAGVILDGICAELRDYGCKVLDKKVEAKDEADSYFFIWYTLDDGDLEREDIYKNPDIWFKANPGMGVCKSIDDMKKIASKAAEQPSSRANFQTKYLNIFVNSAFAWMDMERFRKLKKSNKLKLKGLPFVLSVDLAEKIDICAAVKTYYADNGHLASECKFWLPEGRLKTCTQETKERYERWFANGWLKFTPGDAVDIEMVKTDLRDWVRGEEDNMTEFAYDPWHATQFAIAMQEKYGWEVIEVPQNVRNLNEALRKVEELVFLNGYFPPDNFAFEWMMGNVEVNRDRNGNLFPDKSSRENKIDAASALFTGVSRIIRHVQSDHIPDLPDNMGTL